MLLIADQNIPLAREAFSQFGQVRLAAGRTLSRTDLHQADVLIVRSVTKVNAALLQGTPVRFVGTATIGTDHVDRAFLAAAGIGFASAAGCNARSVVEYVLAALAEHCVATGTDWTGRTLGIVGHGNIGSRLAAAARGLGMNVIVCDPPLAEAGDHPDFLPLETVLAESDYISIHVPLTREGPHATFRMIGEEEFDLLRPDAVFINAARGEVLDNAAALALPESITLILDVFENEPRPDRDVVARCFLASPHIAGYSFEGKINGTRMMADAIARHLGTTSAWAPELPVPADREIALSPQLEGMASVLEAIRRSYPVREDDARLRAGMELSEEAWGLHFDDLRKSYWMRREFANYAIVPPAEDAAAGRILRALGFA